MESSLKLLFSGQRLCLSQIWLSQTYSNLSVLTIIIIIIIVLLLSLPWVPRSDHLDFPFKLGPTGSFEAIISLCLYLVLAVFTAVFLDGLVIF